MSPLSGGRSWAGWKDAGRLRAWTLLDGQGVVVVVVHRADGGRVRVSAGSPWRGAGRLAADESCGWLDGRRCPSVLDGRGASWEDAGRPRGWTLYTTLLFMPTMERVCRAVSIADVNDQVVLTIHTHE